MTDDELSMGDPASAGVPEGRVARALGGVEAYEPPTIVVLGTIAELTQGPAGTGGDVDGMVISF